MPALLVVALNELKVLTRNPHARATRATVARLTRTRACLDPEIPIGVPPSIALSLPALIGRSGDRPDSRGELLRRRVAGQKRVVPCRHRLLQAAEQGGRMGSVIEILVLQALAHQAHGDIPAALMALQGALSLAEPEGYVRSFEEFLREKAIAPPTRPPG